MAVFYCPMVHLNSAPLIPPFAGGYQFPSWMCWQCRIEAFQGKGLPVNCIKCNASIQRVIDEIERQEKNKEND